jgi:S-DNA-T family DNA segregation ATPase FtsK/SpoIIIE
MAARVPAVLVQVPLSVVVLSWIGRTLRSLVGGLIRCTWLAWLIGLAAVCVWMGASDHLAALFAGIGLLAVATACWWWLARASFVSVVQRPLWGWWRARRVYRPRWVLGMGACGLTSRLGGVDHLPRLVRVRSTSAVDEVALAMLPGQVLGDYTGVSDRLAQTFGAIDARVRTVAGRPNELVVWFLSKDPLVKPVAPVASASVTDLGALPVGLREDGLVYRLKLLGSHLLLVGATGAGKSSVVWAILHALAPAVADGLVALWVVDPKGGMELSAGRAMFARFCHGDESETDPVSDLRPSPTAHEHAYADLLEDAVAVMRERQSRLRGVSRLHEPSVEEPLIVLVVDELASLTSYVTDRDAKRRISATLSLLLSQGRAVGVLVVAALQDPRKEVLPARDLFPTRMALRLTDADQVDMVLGDGARARGARCDRIPESLPGVGYVGLDGVAEPVRVRFAYLDDAAVDRLCDRFHPSTDTAITQIGASA